MHKDNTYEILQLQNAGFFLFRRLVIMSTFEIKKPKLDARKARIEIFNDTFQNCQTDSDLISAIEASKEDRCIL